MTSNRLIAANPNLWPLAAAIAITYLIYAALISAPRRAWHWARGLFTAPLHKAPRGHAEPPDEPKDDGHRREQDELVASTDIMRALGHDTYAWRPGTLTIAKVSGHAPWEPVPLRPEPPLAPLPDKKLTDDEVAELKQRFLEAVKHGGHPVILSPEDMEITDKDGRPFPVLEPAPEPPLPVLDMENELQHEWHDHAPLKYHDEGVAGCPSCEARWECPPADPGPLPAWAVKLNHGHTDNDDAVESMLHRALTADVLAELDKEAGR